MSKVRNIANLPLDGGLLCLDFINTVQTRKKDVFYEYLQDYETFLQWCSKVNIISADELAEFEEIIKSLPQKAASAYKRIIEIRELLYKFFSAKSAGEAIDEPVLNEFNALLAEALQHMGFENSSRGLVATWLNPERDLTAPLWKVFKSAYDILVADGSKYVKECSACGWLFLDKSRTHTRRWCNPLECGSVDKATRYYHRMKAKNKEA
jgi:predicted RNA-binding Zn ribbon-like protein